MLDAAARLIAEHGSHGTTFARIGEAAGYSRGVITHYFGSKLALLERLTADVQERFMAAVLPASDGGSGLDAVLVITQRYLQAAASPSVAQHAFAVLWAEAATTAVELRPFFLTRDRIARDLLRDVVSQGIEQGSIRADVDPAAFAAGHISWLRAIALEHALDPEGPSLAAIGAEVAAAVRARCSP